MPVTISPSFLLDIKSVTIGNELWENMKIKLREQLLKPKLPGELLKTEIIGIITNSVFLFLELFAVTERIADTMKKE